MQEDRSSARKIRYAVVGLGHIAQVAVLPAFRNAENSALVGLVSGDANKRTELQRRYSVAHARDYERFEVLLRECDADAVYIALPNHLHAEYAIRAAEAGVHVLCEKPMAVTEDECRAMMDAARANNVHLMIAYRLHFEQSNLSVIEQVCAGRIGEPRVFQGAFTQVVQPDNIRLAPIHKGGGSVYDMGIYCINAARYLFRDEPTEVMAFVKKSADGEHDQTMCASLQFPRGRLAQFVSSFDCHRQSRYTITGTRGEITLNPAFDYAKPMRYAMTVEEGADQIRSFSKRDQFAPQLIYFSRCILEDKAPEPGGIEGLTDVQIIRALHASAAEGRAISLGTAQSQRRPRGGQGITRPGIEKPNEIGASAPSKGD